MKKVVLTVLTAAVIAFTGSLSSAQQKISPEKEALIKELLAVSGSTKNARETAEMMSSIQRIEAEKLVNDMVDADKEMSAEAKEMTKKLSTETVGRITKRLDDFFAKEFDLEKAITEVALPVYDRHYTDAEIRELIAFYRSPVGQKTISVMPQLMTEMLTGFMEKIGPKLRDVLKQTTDEELTFMKKSMEQSKTAPPKPKANE